jgi:alkylation response protein AidB-like acyl-CoA dehydrogenase
VNPYIAPLDEIHFLLNHLTSIENVAAVTGADSLADPELVGLILDQAARFAQEVLAPLDTVGDQKGANWSESGVTTAPGFSEAYKQFIESGWNNVSISGDYGGQGLPALLCAALNEMFVSANKAFCYCPELTAAGIKALSNAGSEELKNTYIPKLVSGEWTATMNLSEPQAGSDVGALRTRAEPQTDGSYRLFGQKIFISFGEHDMSDNIIHMVLARTPDAPAGSRGISLFVVPKFMPESGERNDVKCVGIEHKLGNHGSPTCTLVYGDSGEGAKGWLVGEENKGLAAMFVMINASRFNVGMEGVSLSEKSYQQARNYAQERVQGRLIGSDSKDAVTIINHPDVRRTLMLMRSQTEAMRALAYVIAEARDLAQSQSDPETRKAKQGFVDLMIPIFKGWASETGCDNTSMAIQVYGGMGYIEESGVPQAFRDLRVASIYEGTTAIQAHDLIERKLVKDQGQSYQAWAEQLQACVSELRDNKTEEINDIAEQLEAGIKALDETVHWATQNYIKQPRQVLAGSVPLLKLAGIVAGGWQMARAALVANRLLAAGQGDSEFLKRKLQSARFYASHVLPEAISLALVAKNVGESTLALGDLAFA